jgi:hypothetical protein
MDSNGSVVQTVSWSKAKDGAVVWSASTHIYSSEKTSSSQKKKTSSKTPEEIVSEPVITQAKGGFAYIENGILALRDEKHRLILYRIDSNILSESTLDSYLKPGQKKKNHPYSARRFGGAGRSASKPGSKYTA